VHGVRHALPLRDLLLRPETRDASHAARLSSDEDTLGDEEAAL